VRDGKTRITIALKTKQKHLFVVFVMKLTIAGP